MNTKHRAFDIEYQYQEYLLHRGLREEYLEPAHRQQLKDAFYSAIGIALINLKDYKLTVQEATEGWKSMLEQGGDFFLRDNNQLN